MSLMREMLGPRFVRALSYALELHGEQVREATSIPYISHLLSVCSLMLEDGGNEDVEERISSSRNLPEFRRLVTETLG